MTSTKLKISSGTEENDIQTLHPIPYCKANVPQVCQCTIGLPKAMIPTAGPKTYARVWVPAFHPPGCMIDLSFCQSPFRVGSPQTPQKEQCFTSQLFFAICFRSLSYGLPTYSQRPDPMGGCQRQDSRTQGRKKSKNKTAQEEKQEQNRNSINEPRNMTIPNVQHTHASPSLVPQTVQSLGKSIT